MSKDEALRLALEALKSTGENNGYHGVTQYFDETMVDQAITAIKAALEAKDEPVAWMCADESLINKGYARFSHVCMGEWKIPVYTTPPQRTWVGLTDEEVTICHSLAVLSKKHDGTDPSFTTLLHQQVEAKLKEKNNG